jgi:IclR family transcriptional regulator, KDG regulon repressor
MRLNETVQLAVLDGVENVYLDKLESTKALKLVSRVGSRLPAYATGLGKTLLAFLDPEDRAARLAQLELRPFTERTIHELPALEAELRAIRERGYGTDKGEYTVGVSCIAAPIRNRYGTVVAAVSASLPDVRATDPVMDLVRQEVMAEAEQMSRDLGYAPPGEVA